VLLDLLDDGHKYTPLPIIGLNDFHGQLDPTTMSMDGRNVSVGGAGQLATMFDEDASHLPGETLLLAAGDNVGASPPNSALLEDIPAIDVENAWGLDATSYGNHEFDFGVARILSHLERANFPFLSTNIVDELTGEAPEWLDTSAVFTVNGVQIGVIGSTVRTTKELVKAEATEGLLFLDEAERILAESEKLRSQGIKVQVVVIHEGPTVGANAIDGHPAEAWAGPVIDIVNQLQDTTIDLVIAGHTHRIANTVVGHIPVVEGVNAGGSYSVAQLMVRNGDVEWVGAATRVAKNIGVAPRPDVQTIVDAANAETAVLRNQVIGSLALDPADPTDTGITRAPSRLFESEMGNMVTDAMRLQYPGVDAAVTNSGGLRQDLLFAPSGAEAPGEITWGEVFAVLPFGNRTVIETLTGDQLRAGLLNGLQPACDPAFAGGTGRFPQVSGLLLNYSCSGITPVINTLTRADGSAILATDLIRIVTNDFMFTGGDGYTAFSGGTNVLQPGDDLQALVVEYIGANSPVSPMVEGRITRT
jgi:2',3'-cyclic-nucleotide 2'-phosphodiesterase (5'-nucleotidase family)